jgi:hypothetical protein
MTKKAGIIAYRDQARAQLRRYLRPGTKVYCRLKHCSRSGMRRIIALAVVLNGEFCDITYRAAVALDDTLDSKRDGIVCDGCGMDMGFNLVYRLGCTLWPHGTRKPHGTRNGEPDTAGGYALKSVWL